VNSIAGEFKRAAGDSKSWCAAAQLATSSSAAPAAAAAAAAAPARQVAPVQQVAPAVQKAPPPKLGTKSSVPAPGSKAASARMALASHDYTRSVSRFISLLTNYKGIHQFVIGPATSEKIASAASHLDSNFPNFALYEKYFKR